MNPPRTVPLALLLTMTTVLAIGLAVQAEDGRQGSPDPLLFSTFVGGSDADWPHAVVVGNDGSVFVTGYTLSLNFPTTEGAYQMINKGSEEVYVMHLSSDGSRLLWATLVGGTGQDIAWDLALGTDGRVYVTGVTRSPDFPTTQGAYSRTRDGPSDAFVLCLAPDGGSLVYSTLLGGENDDQGYSLEILDDGRVVLAGNTESVFLPTTQGVLDRGLNGDSDIFVARFSADGRYLQVCTYLGGSYTELEPAIALDTEGDVWVTGSTTSQDFPVTAGLPNDWDLGRDVFVACIDPDLTTLRRATVVGHEGNDVPRSIDLGPDGEVMLAGLTTSTEFPDTGNRPGNDNSGLTDGFVLVFTSSLSRYDHAWLYGGSAVDAVRSASYDDRGLVHLVGYTNSTNFPTTTGSWRPYKIGDDHDMFYAQVDPGQGYLLLNSTYIGKGMGDFGMDLDFDRWGTPIIVGQTRSSDFPTAGDPYDDTHNGAGDVIVLKHTTDEDPPLFSNDTTPGLFEVGSNLTFSIDVADETAILEVWLYYVEDMHDFQRPTSVLIPGNGTYTTTVRISASTLGLSYRFLAWDVLGHFSETGMLEITLFDTLPPELISDRSPEEGTTGDMFVFTITTYDNWFVKSASVEYNIGVRKVNTTMAVSSHDHGYSGWNQSIDLSASSIDPIRYRFHLVDSSGNAVTTQWVQVPVRDDDPPTVGKLDLPDVAYPGTWVTIDVAVTDNIGVVEAWVEYFSEVGQVETLAIEGTYGPRVEVEVPVPTGRGDLHITLRAKDAAGHTAHVSGIVPFRDDTPPELTIIHGNTTTTGGVFALTWTSSDRAGIHSMWGFYAFGQDRAIEDYTYFQAEDLPTAVVEIDVPADSIEPLYIILVAKDAYGNENRTEPIVIQVLDDDPPIAQVGRERWDPIDWESIVLDASGSVDNIGIVRYEWSWSLPGETGRHPISTDGPELSILKNEPGTYEFFLTVYDAAGNQGDTSIVAEVHNDETDEPNGFDDLALVLAATAVVTLALLFVHLYRRSRA
jgi:hypothetical protein